MRFILPRDPASLAHYLPEFIGLVGQDRWLKRTGQLADEMKRSFYQYKIGLDYHWLELCASHQWKIYELRKGLDLSLFATLDLAALNFAATAVEVHRQLNPKGKQVLLGRIEDALKAENGFAALYLELSLTQRLVMSGYDVALPDMEGTAQYDLLVQGAGLCGEVECKSQSADAGRQIHRKDFYRFMEALAPGAALRQSELCNFVCLVTLRSRLRPASADREELLRAVKPVLSNEDVTQAAGADFEIRRIPFDQVDGLDTESLSSEEIHKVLKTAFGQNVHASTLVTSRGGALLAMRSQKEDDPSAPTIEAMRKAASQLTKVNPGFIAVQEHGLDTFDLQLEHVQRRIGTLSNHLFHYYQQRHVNAVYVTAYGAIEDLDGQLRTPGFAVKNPIARPRIGREAEAALMTALATEPGAPRTAYVEKSSGASAVESADVPTDSPNSC